MLPSRRICSSNWVSSSPVFRVKLKHVNAKATYKHNYLQAEFSIRTVQGWVGLTWNTTCYNSSCKKQTEMCGRAIESIA